MASTHSAPEPLRRPTIWEYSRSLGVRDRIDRLFPREECDRLFCLKDCDSLLSQNLAHVPTGGSKLPQS